MRRRAPLAIRARFASRVFAWARAHGLDAAGLARRCDLPDFGDEEEPLVPLAGLRAFGAAVAAGLGDPLLGLHVAQALTPPGYGALGFLARAAANLREALELFVAHAQTLNSTWSVTLEPAGAGVRMHQRIPQEPLSLGAQGNLYFLAGIVVIARRLCGDEAAGPSRVWLAHRGRRQPELERFFGCPVELGREENGLEVASPVLALRVSTFDSALAGRLQKEVLGQTAARAAAGPDPLAKLRRLVREALPAPLALSAAARALAHSPRSLQRRLADERTSYNQEVNRVRRELAEEFLAQGLPIGEVAWRTGFSDARAFCRAFKRWTGATPGLAQQSRKTGQAPPGT